MSDRRLFIVGVGRSGTSLLQSMLASHPDVSYLPETSFFRRYCQSNRLSTEFRKSGMDAVLSILKADHILCRTGIEMESLVPAQMSRGTSVALQIYTALSKRFQKKPSDWLGDKDPRLIEHLPLLFRIFPNAVVMNIIRDPRDVLASKKKAAWSSHRHVWTHVFANRVQIKLGRRAAEKASSSHYCELQYEDLISDPVTVLDKVCKSIGLSYDPAMLSFSDSARRLVAENELQWKSETLGPLLGQNYGKWRQELTSGEKLLTETCCSDAMDFGNYECASGVKAKSWLERLWVITGTLLIKLGTQPYIVHRELANWLAIRRYNQ